MLAIIKNTRFLNIKLAILFHVLISILNICPSFAMDVVDEPDDYTKIKKDNLQNAILEDDQELFSQLLYEDYDLVVNTVIEEHYLHLAVMMKALDCLSLMVKIKEVQQNIDQIDDSGKTALHYAVIQCSLESVKILLYSGAKPQTKDPLGWSPFAYAYKIDDLQLRGYMLSRFFEANNNK